MRVCVCACVRPCERAGGWKGRRELGREGMREAGRQVGREYMCLNVIVISQVPLT